MMMKTGIMIATAATGLLVGSPLAYAACNHGHDHHTKSDHGHHGGHDEGHGSWGGDKPAGHKSKGDCNGNVNQVNTGRSSGLVNVSDVNVAVPINACDTDILSGTLGILARGLHNNDNH